MRGTAPRRSRLRAVGAVAAVVVLALGVAACGDDETTNPPAASADDGTTLTLWTRAGTESVTKAYVAAYNASHKNQVQVTTYPNEEYPARLASAAGAKSLPDIFGSDVVFAPQYASQGLWKDITADFNAFEFKDKVAQAHVKAGTWQNKIYAVPHTIDVSVMLYSQDLYTRAGLDPAKPPTTLNQFAEHARRIATLGGDIKGTYFGGNCGGCVLFTMWPSVWASGGDVLNADGSAATVNGKEMSDVFALYRKLFEEGVAGAGSKDEAGPTWLGALQTGKIGIAPGPSAWLPLIESKGVKVGVAAITGLSGGESTFIGGDVAGIGANSKNARQAFDFLKWTMSEDAQVEVVSKNKGVPTRTDLASNKYSSADPRIVTINSLVAKGKTPYAKNFNAAFNDPQSPWVAMIRGVFFGDAAKSLSEGNTKITNVLKE